MSFSEQIKHSNTDEWYTREEDVRIILDYLYKRKYKKFYAHLIKRKVIL